MLLSNHYPSSSTLCKEAGKDQIWGTDKCQPTGAALNEEEEDKHKVMKSKI